MTVTNYELNYKNLRGRDTTLVSIKLEDKGRYSTHERELVGDRMDESDETLIEAVLDIIRTEMDPAGAIVKTQAQLEQANQKIAQSETKQNEQGEIMDLINKIIRVIALDSIMGEKISYGTTYKELVALFPLAEVGKHTRLMACLPSKTLTLQKSMVKVNVYWFRSIVNLHTTVNH